MSAPTKKDIKYLRLAAAGAEIFSTCSKAQYMSVIVDRFGTVAATGYNGTPPGWQHCVDGGCPRASTQGQGGSYSNCLAVHAEQGALQRADYAAVAGGTIYVNGLPCWECSKAILGSKLSRLVYLGGRSPVDEDQILALLERSNLDVVKVEMEDV